MAQNQVTTGPVRFSDGTTGAVARGGRDGEQMMSQMNARYYEQAYRGRLFTACAIGIAANVIYSTAAGTGGPLIWNPPGSGVNVVLLKVGFNVTTASTVVGTAGVTGNTGQILVPGSVTAIDGPVKNTLVGGVASAVNVYRIGTPTNAGGFIMPLFAVNTQAITVPQGGMQFVDLEGAVICPPSAWISCSSGSATLTTAVSTCGAIWAEVPV
jgi:hypothetical protein